MKRHPRALVALLAFVVIATGCTDGALVPAAPSVSLGPPLPADDGTPALSGAATIQGRVIRVMDFANRSSGASATDGTVIVSVEGTPLLAPIDARGWFQLMDVPGGDLTLRIAGPDFDARVLIRDVREGEVVTVEVTVEGNTARLNSDERAGEAHAKVEIEGVIDAIDWPAQAVEVRGRLIHVVDETIVRYGSEEMALAFLQVGDRVHIRAVRRPGAESRLEAIQIVVQNRKAA